LTKLKIRDLLQSGTDSRRVFYWTCDLVNSRNELQSILAEYIKWAKASVDDRLYIFLDEISAVKDWQKAIKYLYDSGSLQRCLLLLTGSHSIDLRKATESLAGRRGEVGKLENGIPDKILLPMKFAEYAESRNKEVYAELRNLDLLSLPRKFLV
jgi:hypothetical protein